MAKDPAFLFYPGDWLGGTIGMTFEEKGAYMELLMTQFSRGHMTEHMIGHIVGQLWVTLKVKFKQDDKGLWFNERLEEEQNKRKLFTDSRKNNIIGKNQHKKNGHMTSHMENGNENRNKKGGVGENKLVGVSFSDDKLSVVFKNGETQALGEIQTLELKRGNLLPKQITLGQIE